MSRKNFLPLPISLILQPTIFMIRRTLLKRILCSFAFALAVCYSGAFCQNLNHDRFAVIAYFQGDTTNLSRYSLNRLTHICYSFAHLRGNICSLNNDRDTANIRYLTSLKREFPSLKVLLSLGGWGGCPTCSEVFSTEAGRSEFSQSARDLLNSLGVDGIDLDWEYPAVEGYPGHRFTLEDRHNFTLLVRNLRKTLGHGKEITFAAGAFGHCLAHSVEWNELMRYVDRVHLMTYDLANGYSTITGHHTPLFSTSEQKESTDNAIRYLDSVGVPSGKIAIGLAFYARVWEHVQDKNDGLYQTGKFLRYVAYRDIDRYFTPETGYLFRWDSAAQAPFVYSASQRQFGTYDDRHSVTLKTAYALSHHLGGVMFWELKGDTYSDCLLDAIGQVLTDSQTVNHESQ
jgi:chitinase